MSDEETPGPEAEWGDSAPTVIDGAPLAEGVPSEISDQITRTTDLAPVLDEARAAGILEGRADVRDEDFRAGVDAALTALHVYLIENNFDTGQRVGILNQVRKRVKVR